MFSLNIFKRVRTLEQQVSDLQRLVVRPKSRFTVTPVAAPDVTKATQVTHSQVRVPTTTYLSEQPFVEQEKSEVFGERRKGIKHHTKESRQLRELLLLLDVGGVFPVMNADKNFTIPYNKFVYNLNKWCERHGVDKRFRSASIKGGCEIIRIK